MPDDLAKLLAGLFVIAALLGAVFAGVSTFDFVQHLDRQIHGAHCSFIPGMATQTDGVSGCEVALMSRFSSVLRGAVWGGVPIALPGVGLFVFLVCKGISVLLEPEETQRGAALFLFVAATVPVLTSIVMALISLVSLSALCKPCVGIYVASFLCFLLAGATYIAAEHPPPGQALGPVELIPHALWTVALGAAVIGPCALYIAVAPDFSRYIAACGTLDVPDDRYGVFVPLHPNPGGVPTVEVFDPLCPACRALEDRLTRSRHGAALDRQLLLFPLDSACNWMLDESIHPGSCMISEAILCAEDQGDEVIAWAFDRQAEIKALAAEGGADELRTMLTEAFPGTGGCLGSEEVKVQLNKSLRWAVANALQVLTPQVYIDGVALCEEDTDLGLEYMLTKMLDAHERGELAPVAEVAP